jgi:agmatine deiminase
MSDRIDLPAEWAPHVAMWLGWPSDPDLWQDDLASAQEEVAALARVLAAHGERVMLVASTAIAAAQARTAVGRWARVYILPMGDIWLRDTGPIFRFREGREEAVRFRFNGWGGKYDLTGDADTGAAIAAISDTPVIAETAILEGGAIDWDGQGTLLTTRQCLLNPNRNTGWDEARAEAVLAAALGARRVIWLGDGLVNDHTDGHVDNIARFLAPGIVACMSPSGTEDPNADTLRAIEADLRAARDADGRPLHVVTLPSPGLVTDADGEPVPASHMNFLIGQGAVVVPIYGTPSADAALSALAPHFPTRKVVGLPATHILTGGGAFHCISQQQPQAPAPPSRD